MHTVKVMLVLSILLALTIGTSVFASRTLSTTADKLEKQINSIEEKAVSGDWVAAKKELTSIKSDWSKIEDTWTLLLDHMEIDNIDISLLKMSEYVESQNSGLALAELSALKQYIKHIPEKESLNLKNIF